MDAGHAPGEGQDVVGRPAVLPALDDSGRSPNPSICPFLRSWTNGELTMPVPAPADGNTCIAIGDPRRQSLGQQELVCLRTAHADCPRYLRGAMASVDARSPRSVPSVPRATLAALLILVLSAGISFGFVIQRGGLEMPAGASDPRESGMAVVATPAPVATDASATDAPATPAPESAVPATPAPSSSEVPTPSPSPSPSPSLSSSPSPSPTANPTRRPAPSASPRSSRYALLKPCPRRDGCWVYTVRSGDNLFSIANYFGIKLAVLYDWNPRYAAGASLRKGDQVLMPPPTR